jgi:hypothetical protein
MQFWLLGQEVGSFWLPIVTVGIARCHSLQASKQLSFKVKADAKCGSGNRTESIGCLSSPPWYAVLATVTSGNESEGASIGAYSPRPAAPHQSPVATPLSGSSGKRRHGCFEEEARLSVIHNSGSRESPDSGSWRLHR